MGLNIDQITDEKLRRKIREADQQQNRQSALPACDHDECPRSHCLHSTEKRVRVKQSPKPLLNKLEQEWFDILSGRFPNYPRPRAQAVRFKLCNGVTFTPDIFAVSWPQSNGPASPTAFEVKGKHAWDDAIVKIKMAAHEWPEIVWILAWKDNGEWKQQKILP